jgi:hypothetical protein
MEEKIKYVVHYCGDGGMACTHKQKEFNELEELFKFITPLINDKNHYCEPKVRVEKVITKTILAI